MKEIGFEERRQLSFDIFKTFAKICERYNLRYTLAFGSLLGAVRHKGMIPWDDDVDVFLFRDDYNRLINVFNEEEYPNLKLRCFETDSNYPHAVMKLCLKNTIAFDKDGVNRGYGVFLDVFCLDGIGHNYKKALKLRKRQINYLENRFSISKNAFITKIWHKICSLIREGYEKEYYIKLCTKYSINESNYLAITSWYNKDVILKNVFEERILLDFEDGKYYGLEKFHDYLTWQYGDYMKLPPEDQRTPKHEHSYFWI